MSAITHTLGPLRSPLDVCPRGQYARKAVTLCLAAQCFWKEKGLKVFILCTDGRLTAPGTGSDDAASRMHDLGYNMYGLMYGDWDPVRSLCGELQSDLTKLNSAPASDAQVV